MHVREQASRTARLALPWADTPRQVAEGADVVFTSLPAPPEVEHVALGENGLIDGLAAGKVYFDLSTNAPTLVRPLHAVFGERGVSVLDAPVSGGPAGALVRQTGGLGRRRRRRLEPRHGRPALHPLPAWRNQADAPRPDRGEHTFSAGSSPAAGTLQPS